MHEVAAVVALAGVDPEEHFLYLAPYSERRDGPETMADYLNGGRRFFPMHETQHGAERRQPDAPIAHAGWAEPVFIKFEPAWRYVGDALMQARDEQAADSGVNHDEGVRI